jgi:cell division septal protein FtsQ
VPSAARAAALLGVVVGGLALYGLSTAQTFSIRNVEVSPLRWTDRAAVVERLGIDVGTNAFRLSTAGLSDRLEQLPAVQAAAVGVHLPDTLVVSVTERTPILAWRVGDVTFLADRDGVLFALAAKGGDDAAGLPVIVDGRSMSRAVFGVGTRLDAVDLDAATRLASLTPADVGSGATRLAVRITDADGFVVTTSPASWSAVFGSYGAALRSPELIPGQVRLLRSLLFGREADVARIVLADERNGTYLPRPTSR